MWKGIGTSWRKNGFQSWGWPKPKKSARNNSPENTRLYNPAFLPDRFQSSPVANAHSPLHHSTGAMSRIGLGIAALSKNHGQFIGMFPIPVTPYF